jgi:peptide chain release factor 2
METCPGRAANIRRWKSTHFVNRSRISARAAPRSGGTFDYERKKDRLIEVGRELESPDVWQDPERAQALGRERSQLEDAVGTLERIGRVLEESGELLELAADEDDPAAVAGIDRDVAAVRTEVERLEFQRMFSGEMDRKNAFLDIQAGSGGTEAQDWAEMLLRMYLRWAEAQGFDTEIIEASAGEVAGIKSATVSVVGEYAYGWLRTETGVHRLVRKSPFDAGNRRHTSFAAVWVSPEVEDDIDIDIDPSDLRVDVYRASGAGGQHVNRTESAVRITHNPTGIVVQCQNDRSQHKNRATAMKQLKAKLYEFEMQKRRAAAQAIEDSKADIGWGSQIRSYVLDQSRIKDLRTGYEVGNTQAVLDGNLTPFMSASLKQGL